MAWQTTRPSLLERVRDPANDAAWAEFDRSYGELILRYCHRCGLQHSDAEDGAADRPDEPLQCPAEL